MPPIPILAAILLTAVLMGSEAVWGPPVSDEFFDPIYWHCRSGSIAERIACTPASPASPASFTAADAMRILVSLFLLAAVLWVILSRRYGPTDRHWSYGVIGTVVGFWLGGAR